MEHRQCEAGGAKAKHIFTLWTIWTLCIREKDFSSDIKVHISQMAQVTSNKMVHKKRHHFLATFSIPFHMVWSVLLRVVAHKTTFWLVEILWQPIRSFYSMVFEATTRNKTEHTMWKGIENCARKWFLFLCTILFDVTWPFCKMCRISFSK